MQRSKTVHHQNKLSSLQSLLKNLVSTLFIETVEMNTTAAWSEIVGSRVSSFCALNPPLAGRGAHNAPPPSELSQHLKTRADIGVKPTVPYSALIWHQQTKFGRNPSKSFWENDLLVTSCNAIFGQNTANIQMLLEGRILTVKRNPKTPKDAKLRALENGYLEFSNFLCFNHKNSKSSIFFKNKCPKPPFL